MSSDADDALQFLARQGWLAEQPAGFRSKLLSGATVRTADAGAYLHHAGAALTSLLGLAAGSLEIWWDHPLLGRQLIHIAQPGIWLGEPLAYGAPVRLVTARCRTRSTVVVIARRRIEALIREDPNCIRSFGRLSDLHIRECLTGLVEALHADALSRVCARMTTLGFAHARNRDDRVIRLPISQDDLAKLCGMSRKSLGRVVSRLKAAGLVEVHYGVVTLLDRPRLAGIATGADGVSVNAPSQVP